MSMPKPDLFKVTQSASASSPWELLAVAVIVRAAKDWAFGLPDERRSANQFFFSDSRCSPMTARVHDEINATDLYGHPVSVSPGEDYLEEPIFESWLDVRRHWFGLAGFRVPDKAALRALLVTYRINHKGNAEHDSPADVCEDLDLTRPRRRGRPCGSKDSSPRKIRGRIVEKP